MYYLNESSSEPFLEHIYSTISLFSVDNAKIKRGWKIPFFNYIKIK